MNIIEWYYWILFWSVLLNVIISNEDLVKQLTSVNNDKNIIPLPTENSNVSKM